MLNLKEKAVINYQNEYFNKLWINFIIMKILDLSTDITHF